MHPERPEHVQTISSARTSRSVDQHQRMVQYSIAMAIRTLCVILIVVLPSPWRWFFVAGAVLLPYVAVIVANNANPKRREFHAHTEDGVLVPQAYTPPEDPPKAA